MGNYGLVDYEESEENRKAASEIVDATDHETIEANGTTHLKEILIIQESIGSGCNSGARVFGRGYSAQC